MFRVNPEVFFGCFRQASSEKQVGIKAWKEEAGELPVGFNRGPWFGKLHAGEEGMTLHFF